MARRTSLRIGAVGRTPTSPSLRPAAAMAMAPPWLLPVTATRSASTSGKARTMSTARTASVKTRR